MGPGERVRRGKSVWRVATGWRAEPSREGQGRNIQAAPGHRPGILSALSVPSSPSMPSLRSFTLGVCLILLAVGSGATGASAPESLTFEQVAFTTGAKAAQPSVTVDPKEGFVVTWQEKDGEGSALRYAVLDPAGLERRRGLVSSGTERFVNSADFPSLAVLDNGDWVTFWLQKTASGTYAYEVRSVRSRDRGQTWDPPVVIHRDGTPTEHGFVSMVPAGEDRVQLIWLDGRNMASTADAHGEGGDEHMTIRSAILGREGVPSAEKELDSLTCACCQTDLARGASSTVAVYRDRSSKEIRDIGAVVFNAKGNASAPKRVHADNWTMPGCPVNGPALAARGDRFLVAWPTMAAGPMAVRAALGDGSRFDAPATLGEGEAELGRVDAAALPGGEWVVSRVTTRERVPALTLATLSAEGAIAREQVVAAPVGGYPRLAVHGPTVLVVFTEPAGAGDTRITVLRSTPPRTPVATN